MLTQRRAVVLDPLSLASAEWMDVGRTGRNACGRAAALGRHDKRDAQNKENGGDREPDRSPLTKAPRTRGGFATSSPDEKKPLGAVWNPPLPWCPNHTKSRPRQLEATGDEKGSSGYHSGNLSGFLNFSGWADWVTSRRRAAANCPGVPRPGLAANSSASPALIYQIAKAGSRDCRPKSPRWEE